MTGSALILPSAGPGIWAWPPCGTASPASAAAWTSPGAQLRHDHHSHRPRRRAIRAGRPSVSAPPRRGPVRVLVADDHRVVRQGLRVFLATTSDICVVGEASDGSETLTQLDALHDSGEAPDVVLMDLMMSPMDGIEATRQIRARYPRCRSWRSPPSWRRRANAALDAGASGFLLKDADADEVAAAIRAARRGEVHLGPRHRRPSRPGAAGAEHAAARLRPDRARTPGAPACGRRQGQQGHRR